MKHTKLSFKEYYESKDRLRIAGSDSKNFISEYVLLKYCKIPVIEESNSDERLYISLKPKDIVEIAWKMQSSNILEAQHLLINSKKYCPIWKSSKLVEWTTINTTKSKNAI